MSTRVGYELQEGEGLSKTAEGAIVLQGDPEAAFIYKRPGQKVSAELAKKFGFGGKGKKVEEAEVEEEAADSEDSEETPAVELPDGVVPGETPGWPLDAETGKPLELNDDQRGALAEQGISGEIDAEDVDGLVEGLQGESNEEAGEAEEKVEEAKEPSKPAAKKSSGSTKKRASTKKTSAKKPSKRSTKKRG